jgi:hypothetical protein
MSIKGKGRTRSRQVARAPRRAPVEVPKPVYQRRWVQLVAALLLGALAVMFVIWMTNALRASDAEQQATDERQLRQEALTTWRSTVEGELGTVGSLQDALAPSIAPQVRAAAEALSKGKESPVESAELAKLSTNLEAVATTLHDFDLSGTIRDQGFDIGQTDALVSARGEMVAALRELAQGATLLVVAADADSPETSKTLATSALALADSADELMQEAWRKYRNALTEAGLADAAGGGIGLTPQG